MINKEKLSKEINKLLKEHKEISVRLAIMKDGEIVFNEGYGYRDYENKIETDEDTVYAIASISKSFTAAAVAKLVEEGKLEWDKPVKFYIPEFEMYDPYVTKELSVRDILCHRCGLPGHGMVCYLNKYSSEELINKLKYLKPSAPFRNTLQYSNLMYALAGYLIERVTGKRWYEYIDEVIVKPLGMENTFFYPENVEKIENKALPYDLSTGEIVQIPYYHFPLNSTIGAAGSIYSNIKGLLKWMEFNLNKGIYNDKQIIGEKEILECHTPQMLNKTLFYNEFEGIDFQSYGFGWMIESFKGHKIIHHGGNVAGFTSMTGFMPSQNAGFALLTNTNNLKLQLILLYAVYDLILGNENFEYWNKKIVNTMNKELNKVKEGIKMFRSSCAKDSKPSFELEIYTGKYSNPAYGDVEIVKEDSQLFMKSGMGVIPIKHLCVNTFDAVANMNGYEMSIPVEFKTNITGQITGAMIGFESAIKEGIEFKRI